MNKKAITYLGILCVVCPVFYFFSIRAGGIQGGSLFLIGLMWMPTVSAVCTKLIYDHTLKGIGWKIKGWREIGTAYLLPLLSCVIVYGFTWITGIGNCAFIGIVPFIVMGTLGLFGSMITAIGEEIGWRGFLLTELRSSLSYKKINLVIGVIWYIYHLPLIIFSNYNNGNKPASAICFFVMVMSMTAIVNTLCMKAGSMWPAVVLHSSHNLFVQSVFDKMTVNKSYTQYITSEFGIGLALCYAVAAMFIVYKGRNVQQAKLRETA